MDIALPYNQTNAQVSWNSLCLAYAVAWTCTGKQVYVLYGCIRPMSLFWMLRTNTNATFFMNTESFQRIRNWNRGIMIPIFTSLDSQVHFWWLLKTSSSRYSMIVPARHALQEDIWASLHDHVDAQVDLIRYAWQILLRKHHIRCKVHSAQRFYTFKAAHFFFPNISSENESSKLHIESIVRILARKSEITHISWAAAGILCTIEFLQLVWTCMKCASTSPIHTRLCGLSS